MAEQQLIEDKDDDKKKKKEKKKKDKNTPEGMENEEDEGGILSVILVTIVIVLIWLAILALLIKLDVGGFGSNIATPILKNVPVMNRVLPGYSFTASGNGIEGEDGEYAGYDSVDEAVERIKVLEEELLLAQESVNNSQQTIAELNEQISRLETFRDNQVAFEKIRDEYYNEVVFGDSAPDIDEYRKYYEEIDPVNAEILYKQVVQQEQVDEELKNYAKAYSSMKPKDAAEIFESQVMRGYIELSAKILDQMSADARGSILAAMDPEVAGQITKIMEPDENVNTNYVDTGSLLGIPDYDYDTPDNTDNDDTASDNSASENGAN